ncbi:probable amino acid permease 7 [Punica granatum]|uniref:Uncharacterized protein n=2 Tax=Punica granatum TaxID=22663 RepID=A0A2I0HVZ6_PUNGR|nr:probable amino acid permease 7 [Punica granatum]PKI35690.1 hypothetical protein CRG98_043848 [Punica granatum]
MGEEEGDDVQLQARLIESSPAGEASHPLLKRTGTTWTAVAHIITGVIGAGVLSLAWSVAQLGWVLGPICILCFAFITGLSTFLLCDCYKYPDPEFGATRSRSLMEAVRLYLGERQQWICGIFANESLYGTTIAYTITAAASIKAILQSNCYHREGHNAPCEYSDSVYMLLFGLVQIVMSQIPDFHNMGWLSVVAAIMSFSYASIGFGLGLAKVIENGRMKGSIAGVTYTSLTSKLWTSFEAIGDIAYAYPYAVIVLEIQDTLKSPPPESQTMKNASVIALVVTTCFYLCCGCFGYGAFGNDTPGNLLTGFGFYEPYWLVDLGNACIVLHLVGGYQIFSQPIFGTVDRWASRKFPNSRFLNDYSFRFLPRFKVNLFRICFRTLYVMSTTAIAILFPYFNSVIGVLGALNFWPLSIYFPVEMYFAQRKVRAWSREWILLWAFSCFCLLVSAMGFIGSLTELIIEKSS